MTEWAPATDAEVAMRDALRTDDQESYFRILAGVDLLLPVSADALAGLAPLGWGTWSTGGRTHVLAFTSPSALQACLADYKGSARRVAYAELADTWPNLEWWLAVNPGLPIEGYLPAWFVAQLSRGDLRLPTRGPARDGGNAAARPPDLQAAGVAADAAERPSGAQGGDSPGLRAGGDPRRDLAQGIGDARRGSPQRVEDPRRSSVRSGGPSFSPADVAAFAGEADPAGHAAAPDPVDDPTAPGTVGAGGAPVGPGGLPVRSPGAVLPSGLPSRVPATPAGGLDDSSFPGFNARAGAAEASGSSVPAAYQPPGLPATTSPQDPSGALPTRTPMAQTPPLPSHIPAPDTDRGPDLEPSEGLPRRHITAPSERPSSMAAAAQALAGSRPPQSPPLTPSGITPPVIPGAGGLARSAATPLPFGSPDLPNIPPTSVGPPFDQYGRGTSDRDEWEPGAAAQPTADTTVADDFIAANEVEQDLFDAAGERSTDRFLSTLLLAEVLVPVEPNSRPDSSPGEAGFVFRTEEIEGERFLVVFTSQDRLAEHFDEPTRTVGVRFLELIRNWPDPAWSFAINPESPVGATYPGPQVIALASWATDAGLGTESAEVEDRPPVPVPAPHKVSDAAQHATVMQKTVSADQVDYYLERGYDRVAGFVHRANEVEHLRTPADLFGGLGLAHENSPYQSDAKEAYVLRWPAYRPSLYRIPYGGQSEQALRAMDGWVIERPPFRGNGFAPGEGRDVIAEFKVDSVRLPHGAQLWRMDADGSERIIAVFDADTPTWRRVGEQ